jgi:hypothetical protein
VRRRIDERQARRIRGRRLQALRGAKSVSELKADLLADLHERFRELKAEGKDDATAFELTIDSIGDIEQTCRRFPTSPGRSSGNW